MKRLIPAALTLLAFSLGGCALTPPALQESKEDLCALPNVSGFIQAKLIAGSGKFGNIPAHLQGFVRTPYTPYNVGNSDHAEGLDCEVVLRTADNPALAGRVLLHREVGGQPETASIMFYSEQQIAEEAAKRRQAAAAYMQYQLAHPPIQVQVTVVPVAPQWQPTFERYHY